MGLTVLVFIPLFILLRSLFSRQSLMGNYPMRIRWQAHRYLLGQSLTFFTMSLPVVLQLKLCKQLFQ